MAAVMNAHSDDVVDIAGIKAQARRGGEGAPLLIIHGELGVPGWLETYGLLSQSHDVIVPSLPGYGNSERPDWIMGIHDLAAWITWFARDSGISAPVNVIGCSMGGWVAAELATLAPQFFKKMVLVGAMGIKPETGEIFDYFLESGLTGIRRSFHDPDNSAEFAKYFGRQLTPEDTDMIEQHREMTCRVSWKPYMHSLTLPSLLPAIQVPTLLVWGEQDAITPIDSGRIYQRSIPGARLVSVENCGHMPEMESPEKFAALASDFFAD